MVAARSPIHGKNHLHASDWRWIAPLKIGFTAFRMIFLLVILCSCSGLSSEPNIVSTSKLPTVTPTAPPDAGHPPTRVSLAHGADLFNGPQGCAACHGSGGKGDGQVASSFTCSLPDFTNQQMARSQTIQRWFGITSNGNGASADCLMPPWKGRLDEQQRWDVTSYIYSLHTTSDQLAQGQKLWQSNCAACHGETGKGDGPKAQNSPQPMPNFTDPASLIEVSDMNLFQTITNGLGQAMPAFKGQLTDDERWAVGSYARSLAWEPRSTNSATPVATTNVPDGPTVKVSGKIRLGSAGAILPPNQPLTLRVFDLANGSTSNGQTSQTTAAADGSFSFGDVQRQINRVYVVGTQYSNLLQTSTPLLMAAGMGSTVDLSFTLYEVTNDPSVVQVEGVELYLAPLSANSMLVQQVMSFHNISDRLFFMNSANSIELTLPSGVQQITLGTGMVHQFTVGADSVIRNTGPLYPGDSNIQPLEFSYLLPYNSHFVMSMPTAYFMQSLAVHTPQRSGLTPVDRPFIAHDTVQFQNSTYNTFYLQGTVGAGSHLQFSLQSQQDQAVKRQNVLGIVLILTVLLLLATEGAIWRLERRSQLALAYPAQSVDSILNAIADLDSHFESGKVTREAYEAGRMQLKADAIKLLNIE